MTVLLLASLSFFLVRTLPGSPFADEKNLHPAIEKVLLEKWGLDQPLGVQYIDFIGRLVQGDLGPSLMRPEVSVNQRVWEVFSISLGLNSLALLLVFVIAPFLVYLSVRFAVLQRFVSQMSLLFISLPSLFLAPLLIWFFSIYLGWLPVALLETPWHWILPLSVLVLRPMAQLVRMMQTALDKVLKEDFIRTAVAKGLPPRLIFSRHIFPNILTAVLAYLPSLAVGMLSGSFVVEIIFAIPGVGSEFALALAERDYFLLAGLSFVIGVSFVVFSFLSEVLVLWLDPRQAELPEKGTL